MTNGWKANGFTRRDRRESRNAPFPLHVGRYSAKRKPSLPRDTERPQAASQLRDQVTGLIKLGLPDQDKYAELFPSSSVVVGGMPIFGEYAQIWLDSRKIVQGTRNGYKSALNLYWMPHLALVRIDFITTTMLRRIVSAIPWTTPAVKRNALVKLSTILRLAVADNLISRNPSESIQLPKRGRKEIDPFTLDEADVIVARLYDHPHWPSRIYAAFFEFVFFSGVRLAEGLAVQWTDIDKEKRVVRIRRTIALGEVAERTKTGQERVVLLNERALNAIEFAELPFVFPPSKNGVYVKQTSELHHQWRPVLKELGIRYRPPYNCRHTYATICLMSGLNPAFISQQLGHSVQMLLSTYARWINSSSDWSELEKLQIGIKSVSAAMPAT